MSSLIPGVFALIGAFLGAVLTRTIQHEKWLWERRAEVFAEYFRLSQASFKEGSDLLARGDDNNQVELFDEYAPLLTHARIVRLFLSESDRKRFHDLVRRQYQLHSATDEKDWRFTEMDKNDNEIQSMFERALVQPSVRELFKLNWLGGARRK